MDERNWRSGEFVFNTILSAQQLVLSVEEVLPAVLDTDFCCFRRLGNQVHWSERREEKVSSFIGDHQDLVSKRDEFQLVKRQGPACLAIASYSVKRYKRRLHCTALRFSMGDSGRKLCATSLLSKSGLRGR